jgi:hypothetical protein
MDEIYLVSKNKEHTTIEVITSLFTLVIKYKYLFSIASYSDRSPFPFCKIERENAHINEEGASVFPTIWVSFFEEKEIYMTDNNFPILLDGNNYYPIISFQCRESLFLLELMVQIVSENADFLIRNVENRLMGVNELKSALESKNYGWAYIE